MDRKSEWVVFAIGLVVVITLALVLLFGATDARAAGGYLGQSYDDRWDFGDVGGGYHTSSYMSYNGKVYADLYAYLWSDYKIKGVNISLYPEYYVSWDEGSGVYKRTFKCYEVDANFYGEIAPLTLADSTSYSHNNQVNIPRRGIDLSQNVYLDTYKDSYLGQMRSDAGASLCLLNFMSSYANGQYKEFEGTEWVYSEADDSWISKPDGHTYFEYDVSWHGNFKNGQLPEGYILPDSGFGVNIQAAETPEPGTLAMLSIGTLCGVGAWWRRWRRATQVA